MDARRCRLRLLLASFVAGLALPGLALAQPVGSIAVTGATDYTALPPGIIEESIVTNVVEFLFDPAGGSFTASVRLELNHEVPTRECVFSSFHEWAIEGQFDPSTLQFEGTSTELREETIGQCEGFSFVRTFDNDTFEWTGVLDPVAGTIEERRFAEPLQFTLSVDPALLESLVPETSPPTTAGETTTGDGSTTPSTPGADTTEPAQTSTPSETTTDPEGTTNDTTTVAEDTEPDQTAPATAAPEAPGDSGGGFPWFVLLVAPVAAFFVGWAIWRFRRTPPQLFEPREEAVGDCSELERAWRSARDACADKEAAADALGTRFDESVERVRSAERARDGLPSETTRVELPDGRSLSQLDLELRKQAAAEAWNAYLSDPSEETARAAEDAWNEQATDEWLDEQRSRHAAERERLEGEVEQARSDRDALGRDLAEARDIQQAACEKAAELERRLELCRKQEAERRRAEQAAESAPAPAQPEQRGEEPATGRDPEAGEPEPVSPVPPRADGGGDPDPEPEKPCEDGARRWVEFDGPHPFPRALRSKFVKIDVVAIAGSQRRTWLASLDGSDFVTLDGPDGHAQSISTNLFMSLTPGEIRSAFEGPAGLEKFWEPVGAGAVQSFSITLSLEVDGAEAACLQLHICENGEWKPQRDFRSRVSWNNERQSLTAQAMARGNIQAGSGRTPDDYLPEIVGAFTDLQQQVRQAYSDRQQLDDYVRDCEAGRR